MNEKNSVYRTALCIGNYLGICGNAASFVSLCTGSKAWNYNLVTVFLLYSFTYKEAALVSCIRIVCIGFMFGNLFSIVYSLAGAFLSLFCMTLAKKIKGLSMAGVSVIGGVTHNIGQLIIAAWWWKAEVSFSIFRFYFLQEQ